MIKKHPNPKVAYPAAIILVTAFATSMYLLTKVLSNGAYQPTSSSQLIASHPTTSTPLVVVTPTPGKPFSGPGLFHSTLGRISATLPKEWSARDREKDCKDNFCAVDVYGSHKITDASGVLQPNIILGYYKVMNMSTLVEGETPASLKGKTTLIGGNVADIREVKGAVTAFIQVEKSSYIITLTSSEKYEALSPEEKSFLQTIKFD